MVVGVCSAVVGGGRATVEGACPRIMLVDVRRRFRF